MGRIPGANTKPEIVVRSLLHRNGYRFSLHRKDLPGKPDIVLPKYKTVIFVHGCFWHRHKNCPDATTPKTRTDFWTAKFDGNVKRDRNNQRDIKELGWNVVIVWECEIKDREKLLSRIRRTLK